MVISHITTYEVWRAIKEAHEEDLEVFSSYSAPMGGAVHSGIGEMKTVYGLRGADEPLMGARTTWHIDPQHPANRLNERHEYWLYGAVMPEDIYDVLWGCAGSC